MKAIFMFMLHCNDLFSFYLLYFKLNVMSRKCYSEQRLHSIVTTNSAMATNYVFMYDFRGMYGVTTNRATATNCVSLNDQRGIH